MTTFSHSHQSRFAALLIAFASAGPSLAVAQTQDEAAARALFLEGRQLLKARRYEEACPKFEAAKRLYASTGLLLNLADCHEHLNRTASAWTEFGDAAFTAASAGRPKDEAEAKRRQNALEGRLSRLAVRVLAPTRDQIVRRDGAPIDRAAWDSAIPIDPGVHEIAAEAPGRSPWSTSVTVAEPGKTITVEVPELIQVARPEDSRSSTSTNTQRANAPDVPTGMPPEEASSTASPGATQRVLGVVLGAAGIATLGASGVLGLVAKSQYDNASSEHGSPRVTDSANALHLANTASIVLAIGAAATVAGVVVWLTAPSAPVSVGLNAQGLLLSGSFQ